MRKTIVIGRELKDIKKTICECDICHKETTNLKSCSICGKETCIKCGQSIWWNYDGDYPAWGCNKCMEIGKPFMEEYDRLDKECLRKQDGLMKEWRALCVKL